MDLKSKWKKSWKDELIDILLFGSVVRGKTKPQDIDLCLVFRREVNLNLLKEIESILGEDYHLSSLVVDHFFTNPHSLAKTILLEGKSIITGKRFTDNFGLTSFSLYSYDLSSQPPSQKVKFVYLMRGRDGQEGLIRKLKGYFISNNSFVVPLEFDSQLIEVLDQWNIKYNRKKIMMMG